MNILGKDINLKRVIGKTKARSQMCFIITDDGRDVEREIPVLSSCAVDEDLCSGFLIDASNQYQNEETGDWTQVIDEKSTVPLCLRDPSRMEGMVMDKGDKNKSQMTTLLQGIFHHSWTTDLATLDREYEKDKQKAWMYLIFGLAVIVCALAISFQMF